MPIYMKYGSLEGQVTEKGHEKWIDLGSCQFGVGRSVSTPSGSSQNRETSSPNISEIVCSKILDKASGNLFKEAVFGEGKPCTLHFLKTGKGGLELYMEIKMENTLVSSYSISSGGDTPSESFSLNFTKIEYKTLAPDEKGALTVPFSTTYDLTKATSK